METANTKNRYWLYGCIYAALLLTVLLIANFDGFNHILGELLFYLRPVIIGLSIAYLSNPFFRLYEMKLLYRIKPPSLRRFIALCMTYLTLLLILAVLLLLIVPQLITSVLEFIENADVLIDSAVNDVNLWIDRINELIMEEGEEAPPILPLNASKIKDSVKQFFTSLKLDSKTLMNLLNFDTIGAIFGVVRETFHLFADIVFGIFISIYLLNTKEKRYAQIMRARRALFSDVFNDRLTEICTVADQSFGGFLRGKLLDSSIVGVLVYIAISILGVPYAILIAAIVAITDIIPIVGPFIGVIPSAIIILLTEPAKVIPFLLCILVVQQIDGNIIAPKILGENTGVSSLCVMVAITTMGTLWGLAGMVLGVPLFATVLELTNRALDKKLAKKGLPTGTDRYYSEAMSEDGPENTSEPTDDQTACATDLSASADGGEGDVTAFELFALDTYELVKKHSLFTEYSEEELEHFAEDEVELTLIAEMQLDDPNAPSDDVTETEVAEPDTEAKAVAPSEDDMQSPAENNDETEPAPETTADPLTDAE